MHVQVHNIHEKLEQKLDRRDKHEVSLASCAPDSQSRGGRKWALRAETHLFGVQAKMLCLVRLGVHYGSDAFWAGGIEVALCFLCEY